MDNKHSIPAYTFLYIAGMKSSDVKRDTVPTGTCTYRYIHVPVCTFIYMHRNTFSTWVLSLV